MPETLRPVQPFSSLCQPTDLVVVDHLIEFKKAGFYSNYDENLPYTAFNAAIEKCHQLTRNDSALTNPKHYFIISRDRAGLQALDPCPNPCSINSGYDRLKTFQTAIKAVGIIAIIPYVAHNKTPSSQFLYLFGSQIYRQYIQHKKQND